MSAVIDTGSPAQRNTTHSEDASTPVLAHRTTLTGLKALRPQIRALSQITGWRTVLAIAIDWVVIVAMFVFAMQVSQLWAWVFAGVVIAGRQHALLVLMHEASHYRMFKDKGLANAVSNWLCAYPVLIRATTENYRTGHIPHHQHVNTQRDTMIVQKMKKAPQEWAFPQSKGMFLKNLLKDVFGRGIRDLKNFNDDGIPREKKSLIKSDLTLFLLLVIGTISWFELWFPVLVLWFLPVFTILPVLLRLRYTAEHYAVKGTSDLTSSRNYFGPWWERAVLYPHNINYHLAHHLFPAVPFYNLPKLHALLLTIPEYESEREEANAGYFTFSRDSIFKKLTTVN